MTIFAFVFVAITPLFGIQQASANGLYMPSPPQGVGGDDSVTTATGTQCKTSMNSNKGYFDVGVSGSKASSNSNAYDYNGLGLPNQDNALAYARVVIPLGDTPKKMDCNRLLELEIQRLESEIQMLKFSSD
ncbi:MAG: hypothetical protein K9J28_09110 [Sulfuritalea sp.]|nr:hypothetical protein [Sulfuritalea sp.]